MMDTCITCAECYDNSLKDVDFMLQNNFHLTLARDLDIEHIKLDNKRDT